MPLNSCFGTTSGKFDKVIYNDDGTVSGINSAGLNTPESLSPTCCSALNLTYDTNIDECIWQKDCSTEDFTVSIAPKVADGAIFQVGPNEDCTCEVEFDYLIGWNANKLVELAAFNATNLQYDISTTQTTITSLQTSKNIAEGQVTTLQTQLDVLSTQIMGVNQQIGTLESKSVLTSSETTQLTNLKAQALVLNSQKTTLEGQLTAKQGEIVALDSQINSNNTKLNNLNNTLSGTSSYSTMMSSFDSCVKLDVYSSSTLGVQSFVQLQNTNVPSGALEESLLKVDDLLTYLDDNTDGLTGLYLESTPTYTTTTVGGFTTVNGIPLGWNAAFTGNSTANETQIINNLIVEGDALGIEVTSGDFKSPWLHHKMVINDANALALIANNKIKLGFNIKGCNAPFSIMLDNIKINKVCVKTETDEVFVTECPTFELKRIPDNKKSWITSDETQSRKHDLSKRGTDYDVNSNRLVVNTKEIDLDIDPAKAIECGMFKYYQKSVGCNIIEGNPCSCPAGYTPDIGNKKCNLITFTGITSTGPTVISQPGSKTGVYGYLGGYFYPKIDLADPNLPIRRYYTGSTGNLLYTDGTVLAEDYIDFNRPIWGSFNVGMVDGRLNAIGADAPTGWIGWTSCIELTANKTVYVAMGADNFSRFKVNGSLIVEFPETGGIYGSNNNALQHNFKKWHMFPVTLNAGINVIEMEAKNQTGSSSFGAEIYDNDINTLTAATSIATVNVLFSTGNLIGTPFTIGTTAGYTCPTGFSLYTCSGGTPVCYNKAVTNMSGCTDTKTLQDFMTQPITGITTTDNFIDATRNSLIDVKNRQTIKSYGTLDTLYDRYLEPLASCAIPNNSYKYSDVSRVSSLIGNHWVDLVDQVVPSTTIWGATNVIRNTEFDRNKYSYNRYTLQLSGSSFSGIGQSDSGTTVTVTDVGNITGNTQVTTGVVIGNFNEGSEFIGRVTIANGGNPIIPVTTNSNNVPYILIP
tara:strand:- start:196 stop:3123 length:2928 start_codon:yes stop_codon:yes gene_type:complete